MHVKCLIIWCPVLGPDSLAVRPVPHVKSVEQARGEGGEGEHLLHHDSVVTLEGGVHIHVRNHGPDLVRRQEAYTVNQSASISQSVALGRTSDEV